MINLVVFASGSGTNAQRIAEYFEGHPSIRLKAIYCNNPEAYVLQRASDLNISSRQFNREDLRKNGNVLNWLKKDAADYIILAGFLWLIPQELITAYHNRIINIHPALLPAYGGKGMYGNFVHNAVIDNGETESGITIHLVNEEYDKGEHLLQQKVAITKEDTAESLAQKIHQLEHQHFPETIEKYILGNTEGVR